MNYIVHGVAKSWTRLSNFHFNTLKEDKSISFASIIRQKVTSSFFFLITRDSFLLGPSQLILVVNNPPDNEGDVRDIISTSGSGRSP